MRLTTSTSPSHDGPGPLCPAGSAAAAAVIGAALAGVFILDRATGSAPVQHLYYVPIIVGALVFGRRGGVAAAAAAIALYHLGNPRLLALRHEHWDVVQVALFIAVGSITARLADDKRRLQALAITDDLTGLHNLRSFEERLRAMVRQSLAAHLPLAMLVLDVDRLKAINDVHGHLAGAEAVRTVGHIIAERIPAGAVACRYGGDEFVIAVPCCTEAEGRALADELRHAVYATAPVLDGTPFPAHSLSISVGVASRTCAADEPSLTPDRLGEELFRAADRALYTAKARGRNQVCVA